MGKADTYKNQSAELTKVCKCPTHGTRPKLHVVGNKLKISITSNILAQTNIFSRAILHPSAINIIIIIIIIEPSERPNEKQILIVRAFAIFSSKNFKCTTVGTADIYKNQSAGLTKVCKCPNHGIRLKLHIVENKLKISKMTSNILEQTDFFSRAILHPSAIVIIKPGERPKEKHVLIVGRE